MPDKETRDVLQFVIGGMYPSADPATLALNQYHFGLNMTARGGLPQTRPPLVDIGVTLPGGAFKGAGLYSLNAGDSLVMGFGAGVYQQKLYGDLEQLSYLSHPLESSMRRWHFTQADRYFIVQDGYTPDVWEEAVFPLILHGDDMKDQSLIPPHQRVPKGAQMVFCHGRLFVATHFVYDYGSEIWTGNFGRTGFVAGDVKLEHDPDNMLKFTETKYLNEGRRFGMPAELGFITAMTVQKNVMAGGGQGPLIVLARNGASAFSVNTHRDEWLETDLAVTLFQGVGTDGDFSVVHTNSDIMFRGTDGWRTLRQTTSESQGAGLESKSISEEVRTIMKLDNQDSRELCSAAITDDRLLVTVAPEAGSDHFNGLLSLDLLPRAQIRGSEPPIYDSVWTGLDFLQVLKARWNGNERHFVIGRDTNGSNKLLMVDEDQEYDTSSAGKKTSCVSRMYTGLKSFGNALKDNEERYLLLWLSHCYGEIEITAYMRFDKHPLWQQLQSGTIHAGTGFRQRWPRIRIPVEDPKYTIASDQREKSPNGGSTVQFCIEWRGSMRIDKTEMRADELSADDFDSIGNMPALKELATGVAQVELDDYEYRMEP